MTEPKLRTCLGTISFRIWDNEDHDFRLVRHQLPSGSEDVFHLYKVQLPNEETVFVLAENEDNAMRQATCGKGRTIEQQRSLEVGAGVFRIPFRIRGWSACEF